MQIYKKMKKLAAVLEIKQIMYQNHSDCKTCKRKNYLEQLMTRNKDDFFKFVEKNNASGTNDTSTRRVVDSLNDYFANSSRNLASGSDCSNSGETIIRQPIDKTIFLYPTDANEICNII